MTPTWSVCLITGICGIAAALVPTQVAKPPEPAKPAAAEAAPKTFEQLALDAAANYKAWTRISDFARWAPTNCRAPVPEGAQISQSKDSDTHGRKLYFLFVKDKDSYLAIGRAPAMTIPLTRPLRRHAISVRCWSRSRGRTLRSMRPRCRCCPIPKAA